MSKITRKQMDDIMEEAERAVKSWPKWMQDPKMRFDYNKGYDNETEQECEDNEQWDEFEKKMIEDAEQQRKGGSNV